MSTSIIDGTIDAVDLKRARGGLAVYNSIRFQLADGSTRTLTKQVVAKDVADALHVGASGRFYLFSAFDIKGVHGFRSRDGASYYKFAGGNNAKIFLILVIVSILYIALRVTMDGGVPMLSVALAILGSLGYYFMSKGSREAKAQFEEDEGPVPVIAPAAVPG